MPSEHLSRLTTRRTTEATPLTKFCICISSVDINRSSDVARTKRRTACSYVLSMSRYNYLIMYIVCLVHRGHGCLYHSSSSSSSSSKNRLTTRPTTQE